MFIDLLQRTRNRIIQEMLKPLSKRGSKYKVLILDAITTRLMSQLFEDYEIYHEYVFKIEGLCSKRSFELRSGAIYFIQPTKKNVERLLEDISIHLYTMWYVFFTTPIEKELLRKITCKQSVLRYIGGLYEMNLEYFMVSNQAFTTNNSKILNYILEINIQDNLQYIIDSIAIHPVTLFASMKEFPHVRYQIVPSQDAIFNDSIPTKVAARFWDQLLRYKGKFPQYPTIETCELVIVHRLVDLIGLMRHDLSYGVLCHDTLPLQDNVFQYEDITNEKKKYVNLDWRNHRWIKLQHMNIEDAKIAIESEKQEFISNNASMQYKLRNLSNEDLDVKSIKKIASSIPTYLNEYPLITSHSHIINKLIKNINEQY